MRRTGVLVVLAWLQSCGGDPSTDGDLHSLTTCDITTSNPGMPCERACATRRDGTGIGCPARSIEPPPDGTAVDCAETFGLDGVIGCCVVLPDTILLRFAECE